MNPEKAKALAANVVALMKNYDSQQRNTADLFKICLEFLEEQRTGHEFGGGKAAMIRRNERKQQLIAAIKGYIQMIEARGQGGNHVVANKP